MSKGNRQLSHHKRWALWFVCCLVPSVFAQDSWIYSIPGIDTSVIDIFMQPGYDYSIRILNDVAGTMQNISSLSNRTSPYAVVTLNLVTYFTQGMFAIALTLVTYTTIMGTIYTSGEGEAMGRKFQTFYVFFRSFTAIALYFPMSSGYSLMQTLMSNVVITSIMLANYAWYAVASLMVSAIGGSFGLSLLGSVNSEFSFDQVTQSTTTQISNFVNQTTSTYLSASGTSQLASQAFAMGQFAQMVCTYSNYYNADTSNGISNAEAAITGMIYCTDSSCPFMGDNMTTSFSLTLPTPNSGQVLADCGVLNYSVNSSYLGSSSSSVIQPYLASMNQYAKTYYTTFIANNKEINPTDSEVGQTIASSLYTLVSNNISSQVTTYSQDVNTSSSGSTSQDQWVNNLIAGGWAMAASNYFYYAFQLFSSASSMTETVNYDTYLYAVPTSTDNYSFCTSDTSQPLSAVCNYLLNNGSSTLGGRDYCLTYPTSTQCGGSSDTTSTDSSSMSACAQSISQCSNISQYLMANEQSNGETIVTAKDFVTVFYSGWSAQIPDINQVQSFAQIQSMTKVCNIPFGASTLNTCETSGSFITPEDLSTSSPEAVLSTGVALAAVPMHALWIGMMSVFSAYYSGVAFYQNYADIYTIWSDPNKLYPDTLALSVQSFTYFTVKAWFDTFANNQPMVFAFPVQAISAFGYKVLLYCVAFIFNVGTATFSANITMTIEMFFRQVLLDAAIAVGQWYAQFPADYGWWWIYSLEDEVGVAEEWEAWTKDTGIDVPCPFPWIIWILFIPIFVYLIIGMIVIIVGYIINVIALAATIVEIFNPAQVVLQINSYIISKWNPLYFAIATPVISVATLFAFFLPLYPVMIYALTVMTWALQYIETLLAMPIILLGMANPEGHSALMGKAEKAMMLLALLFMRPLATLMGFVMGNFVASISTVMFYNIIIPLLDMQIGAWAQGYASLVLGGTVGAAKVLDTGNVLIQAVMTMLALIMFTMVFYYMILNAYSLIYKLPNALSKWIGMGEESSQEEQILQEISGEMKSITGTLTSAGTEVAGNAGSGSAAGSGLDATKNYKEAKGSYKADKGQADAKKKKKAEK